MKDVFVKALETNDRNTLKLLPKSDLHIHSNRGCNRKTIEYMNTTKFEEVPRFQSLEEMDIWYDKTIGKYLKGKEGLLLRYKLMLNDFATQSITVAAPIFCLDMAKNERIN